MNARRHTKFVREGSYAAEVDVELIEEENGWSPYLSLDDARKLDDVREALRRGAPEAATRAGPGFRLTPLPRCCVGRESRCAGGRAGPNPIPRPERPAPGPNRRCKH